MTVQAIDDGGLPNSTIDANSRLGNVASYGTVNSESIEYNIPPPDGGKAAWLFLAGCFFLEGFVWGKSSLAGPAMTIISERMTNGIAQGLPYSYGVFEKYYSEHELFSDQSGVAAIGTVGIVRMSFPIVKRHSNESLGHCVFHRSFSDPGLAAVARSSKACFCHRSIHHCCIPHCSLFCNQCSPLDCDSRIVVRDRGRSSL